MFILKNVVYYTVAYVRQLAIGITVWLNLCLQLNISSFICKKDEVERVESVIAIIVSYNRKVLLKEAIDHLLKQSYKDFDILVVDNASTDGTK